MERINTSSNTEINPTR